MSAKVLFAAGARNWSEWQGPLEHAFRDAGLAVTLVTEAAPQTVDFLIYAPGGDTPTDFAPFTRCRAVLSLWAGVERIVGNASLTQPLCRMVDPGLTQGMIEYVTGHVLRYHLGIDATLAMQNGQWAPVVPPLASDRPVALLGLGALGAACGQALARLGFQVLGWSRRPKTVEGLECHHGAEGLDTVLRRAQIVVTLLPSTPQTENILNARSLSLLPRGARLINPGRGTLIDDGALLSALESGQIGHATLDVFRQEPLPAEHPYWHHPHVTVTPHVAADTRAETAARVIAENVRRGLAGEVLLNQVDRRAGY